MTPEFIPSSQRDDSLTAKVAALANLQSIIARMASTSQQMKNWSVTIVTGFIAITSQLKEIGCLYYFVPALICAIFAYLDSYYLSQEKIFRKIYDRLSNIPVGSGVNYFKFDDEINKEKNNKENTTKNSFRSSSIKPFYISMAVISIIILIKG